VTILFVSKILLRLHHILCFSPPLFPRALSVASQPSRGDVGVLPAAEDDSTDYFTRVIGLPGDRIQMIDGVLHINESPSA